MIVFQTLYSQTAEPLEKDVLRPQKPEYAFPEGEKESGKLVLYTKGKMILKKLRLKTWGLRASRREPGEYIFQKAEAMPCCTDKFLREFNFDLKWSKTRRYRFPWDGEQTKLRVSA